MVGKKIGVLIVDDSLLFRKKLEQSLSADPRIEIVGTAMDPADAMKKIEALNPDVLTLDVEMPKMNGIEFLKKLMPQRPIPTIVVTSLPLNALDALQAGAVDFVKKPVVKGPNDLKNFIKDLAFKIKIASTAKVRRALPATARTMPSLTQRLSANKSYSPNQIIAIGASTGGTEAILEVVKDLPPKTPGIVIVQHIPPVFSKMYAQRLDKICKMSCKEAEDNDRVLPGRIIVAAGEYHMRLAKDAKGYYIRSQKGERVNGHCPSVDVLFNSVAEVAGKDAIGIILTGMGADGARGIVKMRKTGSYTIGQDQATSVVYGMPMEAYKMGGVCKELPLDQIGDEILYQLNK